MITLDNVSYSYAEGNLALDDVSLRIREGEFVCIAGGNGSGKSTLARHLNALLLPSEGNVSVLGQSTADPAAVKSVLSQVAMVFQNPDDSLVASTVEDEVSFGPANLGAPSAELRRRVGECLRTVGLEGYEKRDVNALSGGQKQRLALAGALAMAPRILILDEATSMLDPQGRNDVLSLAKRLHRNGLTVIMITHFMDEALEADRLILLKEGRIVADGQPSALLTDRPLMKSVGLEQPHAAYLSTLLRSQGLQVPSTCNEETLKEALCRLR